MSEPRDEAARRAIEAKQLEDAEKLKGALTQLFLAGKEATGPVRRRASSAISSAASSVGKAVSGFAERRLPTVSRRISKAYKNFREWIAGSQETVDAALATLQAAKDAADLLERVKKTDPDAVKDIVTGAAAAAGVSLDPKALKSGAVELAREVVVEIQGAAKKELDDVGNRLVNAAKDADKPRVRESWRESVRRGAVNLDKLADEAGINPNNPMPASDVEPGPLGAGAQATSGSRQSTRAQLPPLPPRGPKSQDSESVQKRITMQSLLKTLQELPPEERMKIMKDLAAAENGPSAKQSEAKTAAYAPDDPTVFFVTLQTNKAIAENNINGVTEAQKNAYVQRIMKIISMMKINPLEGNEARISTIIQGKISGIKDAPGEQQTASVQLNATGGPAARPPVEQKQEDPMLALIRAQAQKAALSREKSGKNLFEGLEKKGQGQRKVAGAESLFSGKDAEKMLARRNATQSPESDDEAGWSDDDSKKTKKGPNKGGG